MQMDAGLGPEVEVANSEIGNFLRASAGVIQEQEKRLLPQCVASVPRKVFEQ